MRMMVEFAEAPMAIGTRTPRFSWEVPLMGRARRQSAFQILVATREDLLEPDKADLWNSGRVESGQSTNVTYAGADLKSNIDCHWAVRLWDESGHDLDFGPPQRFGTPLYGASDWTGQWIGLGDPDEPIPNPDAFAPAMNRDDGGGDDADSDPPARIDPAIAAFEPESRAPMLRRVFDVSSPIRRARAFVCGVGLFELRLNGEKVGDDVLATPRTDFRKRVLYSAYDVTSRLTQGKNAIGLILGNGWYNGQKKFWRWQMPWFGSPRAILQLEIEHDDGTVQRVVTDTAWRGAWSPITGNCLYDGEDYDGRLEQPGWDSPDFDASAWVPVNVVPGPGGTLAPVTHAQGRVVETAEPVSMREIEPGVFVYDMGRNMTGWARLRITGGRAGETVVMRFAEQVHNDGSLDGSTAGGARQADRYIMKGADEEFYEPRFTYHGFQYVELTGYPGLPEIASLEGRVVHTDVRQTGSFACSHPLISRIHECTVQSQRCNIQMGVVTDDTQRAERLGWCGDIWAMANESYYNFWMPRVYAKWIVDCRDQQDELGMVGYITPLSGPAEDLVWSAAFLIVPWLQYRHLGDRRILEEAYPALQRYVAYLEATGRCELSELTTKQLRQRMRWRNDPERFPGESEHGCLQTSFFGDHLATNEGASGFSKSQPISIATAFYYHDVDLMSRIARVLGRDQDARRYDELKAQIRRAFNERFLVAAFNYYDTGCQSAQAWALAFGLVPDEHRAAVASYLCSSVNFRQRRLTTGYAGTKWAIRALADAGRDDIIWNRATDTHYPSWGFMLRDPNRTTITENWHGAGSLCHTVLGAAIDEWFYWGLAGIRPDENAPGYERIIFKPYLPADLTWARASVQTLRGEVVSAWRKDVETAHLTVAIPANSAATVHIPSGDLEQISESGVPCAEAAGLSLLRSGESDTVFEAGSGTYRFTFPTP